MLETSYSPAIYSSPPSHSSNTWSSASAAAGPKGLAWKVSGPPPGTTQHTNTLYGNPDIYPSAAPTAAASGGALAAGKPTAAYSRHSAGVGQAAAITAGGKATAGGTLNAVLGPGVAGYTSVVTRSPISPSGYPVPAAPKPSGQHQLVGAGSHTYAQQQQQPATSYTSLSDLMQRPGNLRSTSAEAQAAAAAAALAALNSHARSSSMLAEPAAVPALNGSYAQQYTAKNYTSGPGPSSFSSRGSMLLWNIKQPPQATEQPTTPVAGRRAATAIAAGQQLTAAVPAGYIPSGPPGSNEGSSSSRPSSQEAGSPGLLKLKQLSTARLARRLGTPPGGQPAQANSGVGLFGQRPAEPAAAAGPRSGQSSTGATSYMSQQSPGVQQPQQQLQQQHPPQPQWQRSAASIGRRADATHFANVSSSSSSTAGPSAPLGASVQRGAAVGPARNLSNRQVSFARGFDGATERGTLREVQGTAPAEAEYVELARQPCSSCGRCFAPAALKQHMRICDKVFNQKRKVFDTKAQRLQGTGAAAVAVRQRGRSSGSSSGQRQQQQQGGRSFDARPAASAAQAKKSKWQLQSEQLRAAMRASRPQAAGGAGGSGWDGAPAQVEDTRVPCPHCGRRFAELVAERHIPKCSSIIAKPGRLKASGGRAAYMRCNSGGGR